MNLEKFYDKAYDWIILKAPPLIIAIITLLVGLWLIKVIKKAIVQALERKNIDPSLRPFIQSVLIISLQAMLLLVVLQVAGYQLTILTTVIGAITVASGLALSGTLQNFASGVLILILKPFKAGDNVIAQGQEGTVSSIQIFYTVVTTYDNKTVIIPNSKLSNEIIINVSRQGKRRMDVELKFNYGYDIPAVKNIIMKSVNSAENILSVPVPVIGVSSLDADGYKIIINVWVDAFSFADTKLRFQEKLITDLKDAGIKLPGM